MKGRGIYEAKETESDQDPSKFRQDDGLHRSKAPKPVMVVEAEKVTEIWYRNFYKTLALSLNNCVTGKLVNFSRLLIPCL